MDFQLYEFHCSRQFSGVSESQNNEASVVIISSAFISETLFEITYRSTNLFHLFFVANKTMKYLTFIHAYYWGYIDWYCLWACTQSYAFVRYSITHQNLLARNYILMTPFSNAKCFIYSKVNNLLSFWFSFIMLEALKGKFHNFSYLQIPKYVIQHRTSKMIISHMCWLISKRFFFLKFQLNPNINII